MWRVAPGPLWADGTVIMNVVVPLGSEAPPRQESPVVADWFR
jgi:hypothetical protein